jgi:hypothetical protein
MQRRRILCTYNCLLISNKFCNGGSGPSSAIKFLYAPAPPPPSVWALKPPSWALVHETSYDLYSPCIMFWMHIHYLGKWEGVGPWKSRVFWAPNGTRLSARCHFTRPKNSRIPGLNPLPLALVMDMHSSKILCIKLQRFLNLRYWSMGGET